MELELRRCEHWEAREGVVAADVCAKQMQGEAPSARCGGGQALWLFCVYAWCACACACVLEGKAHGGCRLRMVRGRTLRDAWRAEARTLGPTRQPAPLRREQRLAAQLGGQEPLLYICTYLLLNMAEDSAVEQKMLRKVGGRGGADCSGDVGLFGIPRLAN